MFLPPQYHNHAMAAYVAWLLLSWGGRCAYGGCVMPDVPCCVRVLQPPWEFQAAMSMPQRRPLLNHRPAFGSARGFHWGAPSRGWGGRAHAGRFGSVGFGSRKNGQMFKKLRCSPAHAAAECSIFCWFGGVQRPENGKKNYTWYFFRVVRRGPAVQGGMVASLKKGRPLGLFSGDTNFAV